MESWLQIVLRQMMLYSLPILISAGLIGLLEARLYPKSEPSKSPFYTIAWRGFWLPWLASIAFTRGVIIAPSRPMAPGVKGALLRLGGHLMCALLGWLLYLWMLGHKPPTGLPPLHHWWAKVFMYFNLCMIFLHLLPLPGFLAGEWLSRVCRRQWLSEDAALWLLVVLAASPLLDWLLGGWLIYPIYEHLATFAALHA